MEQSLSSSLIPLTNQAQSMFIQAKADFGYNLLRWVKNQVINVETIDQVID